MVYLLYGEEKYDLYKFVDSIKEKFDNLELGINLMYITKENIDEISSISDTFTFFGGNKLVIIKNTNLKFDIDKIIAKSDDIFLVIEDNVDKRTVEYKKLIKNCEVKEFKKLSNKEMTSYIISILKKYKIKISNSDAEYMTEVCGTDKNNIINELNKIVTYLNDNDTVTKEIIDKICVKTLNAKIFDMLDYAINKDKEKAIDLLDNLILQKEPVIKISIMLYKQIKQIFMIKCLKENNTNDINSILKINPYVYGKIIKSVDKYNIEDLKMLITKFDEYDYKTKIGEINFEIGLKQIICIM